MGIVTDMNELKTDIVVAAGVKLLPYCISSALAIIPWSILFCYFGSLARNITEILDGKAGPSGKQSMLLLGVSGAVLVFVVVYSTIIARWVPLGMLPRSCHGLLCPPRHTARAVLASSPCRLKPCLSSWPECFQGGRLRQTAQTPNGA